MNIKKEDLFLDKQILADHYQSALYGRFCSSKGGTCLKIMYSGGVIFVDHMLGYINIFHQTRLDSAKTMKAKVKFKSNVHNNWVVIQQFHTANGIFGSTAFTNHLLSSNQSI